MGGVAPLSPKKFVLGNTRGVSQVVVISPNNEYNKTVGKSIGIGHVVGVFLRRLIQLF